MKDITEKSRKIKYSDQYQQNFLPKGTAQETQPSSKESNKKIETL